jgi:tetratricopeptide (TPR) repeat protein
VFAVMVCSAVFFVGIAVLPFLVVNAGGSRKIVLPAIMASLVCVWAAVRVAADPVPAVATPIAAPAVRERISITPEQQELLKQAIEHAERKEYAAAEALLDQIITGMPDSKGAACWPLAHLKLDYITSQDDFERAEKLCLDWVDRAVTTEEKVRILDAFACEVLYRSVSSFLPTAERLVRQAFELAPGTLTLQGTLGAILVEKGRFAEAEPLIRECLEGSPELHDQGISAFYLGIIKLNNGELRKGKRLIKRGMVLHPEPWLLAKAEAKLKELHE